MAKIAAVILAAGESSRLGEPKQLLPFRKTALINHIISSVCGAHIFPVFVVTGAFHDKVKAAITSDVRICFNENWKQGMGMSISVGLTCALEVDPAITAVMLFVCDQPSITSDHINAMTAKYEAGNRGLLVSSYSDTIGTPGIVGRHYFNHLLSLQGQDGAKKIFMQFRDDLETFPFPGGSTDIDTQEDYLNLMAGND